MLEHPACFSREMQCNNRRRGGGLCDKSFKFRVLERARSMGRRKRPRGGWPRAFAYSFLGLVHISYNIPKWSPRRNTYERQEGRGRKRCINACGCCTHSPLLLLQGQEGHVLMLGSAYFSPRGCVKLAQAAGRRDTRNLLERNRHRCVVQRNHVRFMHFC